MNAAFWNTFGADWRANCALWERSAKPFLAASGAGWTKSAVANPAFFGDTLYYRGTGIAIGDEEERDQILAMNFGDKVHRLVVPSGGPDAFDADALDPAPVEFDGEIFLYYSALGCEGDSVGLAISEGDTRFIKAGPIMAGRAPSPVVWNGAVYLVTQAPIESGGYGLKLFRSADGRSFAPAHDGWIFEPEAGAWDGLSVVTARVFPDASEFYMIYGGSADTVDEPAYFGLARSTDLTNWERHPGNPIFGAGARGEADGGCIWFPALRRTEQGVEMLYEGSVGTPLWGLDCSICSAFLRIRS